MHDSEVFHNDQLTAYSIRSLVLGEINMVASNNHEESSVPNKDIMPPRGVAVHGNVLFAQAGGKALV